MGEVIGESELVMKYEIFVSQCRDVIICKMYCIIINWTNYQVQQKVESH